MPAPPDDSGMPALPSDTSRTGSSCSILPHMPGCSGGPSRGTDRLTLPAPHRGTVPGMVRTRTPLREGTHADDDLRVWMADVLERQQSTFQKLVIQQHEALSVSLSEKIEQVATLFANGPQERDQHGNSFEPLPSGLLLMEGGSRELQAKEAMREFQVQFHTGGSAQVCPTEGDAAGGMGAGEKRLSRSLTERAAHQPLKDRSAGTRVSEVPDTSFGGRLKCTVRSNVFDLCMGAIIVANMLCMYVQLEWGGWVAGKELSLRPQEDGWNGAESIFVAFEEVFNVCFVLELILRIYTYRWLYFRETLNVFDAMVVVLTCADAYVYRPMLSTTSDVAGEDSARGFGGLLRVFRVVRIFKVLRFLTQFAELRILMRALVESASAFLWSMLLAGIIMLSGGIFMATVTSEFILSESLELDTREWLYRYYGSAGRATYTMFEVTFSGGWPNYARRTVEDVSSTFLLFWMVYILGVTFAMVRVIAALFLKQTMHVAGQEKEKMKLESAKQKEDFEQRLATFLDEMDTSGDKVLSRAELNELLDNPELKTMLSQAGLDENEVEGMYNIWDEGSGKVAMDDFLDGAVILKRSGVEAVEAFKGQQKLTRMISQVLTGFDKLWDELRVRRTWRATDAPPRSASKPPSCSSSRPQSARGGQNAGLSTAVAVAC